MLNRDYYQEELGMTLYFPYVYDKYAKPLLEKLELLSI